MHPKRSQFDCQGGEQNVLGWSTRELSWELPWHIVAVGERSAPSPKLVNEGTKSGEWTGVPIEEHVSVTESESDDVPGLEGPP